jgi:hypothetical protein
VHQVRLDGLAYFHRIMMAYLDLKAGSFREDRLRGSDAGGLGWFRHRLV